jgi:ABC-2 type transport system permease protein
MGEKTAVSYKKYPLTAVFIIAAVLAVNIFADVLAGEGNLSIDVTKEQYSVLSGTTISILGGLDKDVYLYYAGKSQQQDIITTQLLKSYSSASKRIHYRLIDKNNMQVIDDFKDEDIRDRSVIVSDTDVFSGNPPVKYATLSYDDLYSDLGLNHGSPGGGETIVYSGEQRITSAIQYIEGGSEARVVFLTGQEEEKPCSPLLADITELFYKSDFQSEEVALDPSSDTLVIISPKKDISDAGLTNIENFLDSGGHALFFISSMSVDETTGETSIPGVLDNFRSLLNGYGISVNSDLVLGGNPSRTYKSPANIIPSVETEEGLPFETSLRPVLDYASSITLTDAQGAAVKPVLVTDGSCYAKAISRQTSGLDKAPGDSTGPFIVGAAVKKGSASIAVFTTSSFMVSEEDYSYQGNSMLFMETLSYLSSKPGGISIGSKVVYSLRDPSYSLVSTPGLLRILFFMAVVCILPVTPVVLGVSGKFKRRV